MFFNPSLMRLFLVIFVFLLLQCCAAASLRAEAIPEDANGDGDVDAEDVFYLTNYLYGFGPVPQNRCDLNGDKAIDQKDLNILTSSVYGYEDLVSKSIGPEGGIIEKDGFKITIPPNGAVGQTVVKIEVGDRSILPAYAGSPLYRIYGLPQGLEGDLVIVIPPEPAEARVDQSNPPTMSVNVNPDPETRWVELREMGITTGGGQSVLMGYVLEQMMDDLGRMVVRIGKSVGNTLLEIADSRLGIFSATRGRRYKTPEGHFEIMMNEQQWSSYQVRIKELGVILENDYAALRDGLGLDWYKKGLAVRVVFEDLGPNLAGEAVTSKLTEYLDFLVISEDLLKNGIKWEAQSVILHELFHLLQNQYDPRWAVGPRQTFLTSYDHFWLNEATATWAEDYFITHGTPYKFNEHFLKGITSGIQKEAASEQEIEAIKVEDPTLSSREIRHTALQRHGYGYAGLIKFVENNWGAKTVGSIYKNLYDCWSSLLDCRNGIDALKKTINPGSPENNAWWRLYLRQLLTGELYADVLANIESEMKSEMPSSITSIDTPIGSDFINRTSTVQDYSARPYLVELKGSMTANNAVTFSSWELLPNGDGYGLFYGDFGVMAFKVLKNNIEYIQGNGLETQETVSNILELRNAEAKLLILALYNNQEYPYSKQSSLHFTANLGTTAPISFSNEYISGQFSLLGLYNVFRSTIPGTSGIRSYWAHFPQSGSIAASFSAQTQHTCMSEHDYSYTLSIMGNDIADPVYLSCPATIAYSGNFAISQNPGFSFGYYDFDKPLSSNYTRIWVAVSDMGYHK